MSTSQILALLPVLRRLLTKSENPTTYLGFVSTFYRLT
jgi:hypothetical protein